MKLKNMNIENGEVGKYKHTPSYLLSLVTANVIAGCWIAIDASGIFSEYGIIMYDGSISVLSIPWTVIPLILVVTSVFLAYKLLRGGLSKNKTNISLTALMLIFCVFSVMPGPFYTIPIFLSVMTLAYLWSSLFGKGQSLSVDSGQLNIWYKLITVLLFLVLIIPSLLVAYSLAVLGALGGTFSIFLVYVSLLITSIIILVLLSRFIKNRSGFTKKSIKIIWLYLFVAASILGGGPFVFMILLSV